MKNQGYVMISFGHVVNPFKVPEGNELTWVNPITFESMRRAKEHVKGKIEVTLYSAQFEQDHEAVPEGFVKTPDLKRTILEDPNVKGKIKKPYPYLDDAIRNLYENSDAEYLIYTNTDIALMPNFYEAIAELIKQGYDAFSVNRRAIPYHYQNPEELLLMYSEAGEYHPGHDCFVFHRDNYPKYRIFDTIIGANHICKVMYLNLFAFSKNFRHLRHRHLTFHIGGDGPRLHDRRFLEYDRHNQAQLRKLIAYVEGHEDLMATKRMQEEIARNHKYALQHTPKTRLISEIDRYYRQSVYEGRRFGKFLMKEGKRWSNHAKVLKEHMGNPKA